MFEFDIESNIIQGIIEPKINYYKLNKGLKRAINDAIKSKQEEKEAFKKVKKENEKALQKMKKIKIKIFRKRKMFKRRL